MRYCWLTITVVLVCFCCTFAALSDMLQPVGLDQVPKVTPLPRVTVWADGRSTGLATSSATVRDLLELLGLSLGRLDRTSPSPSAPIREGLQVRVTRVSCREFVQETALASRVVVLGDPDRPVGYTSILAHGAEGRVRRTWRVWTKDGEETRRGIAREEILSRPADTVVVRGTRGLPSRGGDWRRPLVMEATAYDPGPRSCGRYADGYTATGVKAERGVVAVDDRIIPMGTRMYIPGYGFAVAADRGSAIRGMRIDLCFPTYREAVQFGRRKVQVYLLD